MSPVWLVRVWLSFAVAVGVGGLFVKSSETENALQHLAPDEVLISANETSCRVGYLVGQCRFSLECRNMRGYPQKTCQIRYQIRSCCTTRTTLSVSPDISSLDPSYHGTSTDCGTFQVFPNLSGKIVNGTVSKYGQFPWIVSLRVHVKLTVETIVSVHFCGGALLNSHWVVSSAHCMFKKDPDYIEIRIGEYISDSTNEPHQYVARTIDSTIIHPNFKKADFSNDIVLLKMNSPVSFQPNIRPICLPGNNDSLTGRMGVVSGWGRVKEREKSSPVIRMVSLPILSNRECENIYRKGNRSERIPEDSLCAGYEHGGQDACEGDSGGPLQMKGEDGRIFLAGIVSWGYGCARPFKPGVFTRVSKFVPWIIKTVQDDL